LKPATDFCFKGWEAIWLTPSTSLEFSFVLLRDYEVTVTTACSLANVVAALVVLLVITLSVATLIVVDLSDGDQIVFFEY